MFGWFGSVKWSELENSSAVEGVMQLDFIGVSPWCVVLVAISILAPEPPQSADSGAPVPIARVPAVLQFLLDGMFQIPQLPQEHRRRVEGNHPGGRKWIAYGMVQEELLEAWIPIDPPGAKEWHHDAMRKMTAKCHQIVGVRLRGEVEEVECEAHVQVC
jgi:hypothetical protein